MPGEQRRVETEWIVDPEIGELRTDPSLVDDPVSEMTPGKRHVRLERPLDQLPVRGSPAQPREHADVSAVDEAEPSRAARDLSELPREERSPLLTVELRRLGEEKRLAREIDPVSEHVRRDAHVRGSREKPVDLLTT